MTTTRERLSKSIRKALLDAWDSNFSMENTIDFVLGAVEWEALDCEPLPGPPAKCKHENFDIYGRCGLCGRMDLDEAERLRIEMRREAGMNKAEGREC